ncbi:HAMP domain-containing sensor histidine kinase [Novosphingobium sp. PP1Y]|uniref:sensor histidine kinase n=1 Tax=Novosphingobium sp. PP1Y TaxID=702113 RepID=UPI00020EEC43|nr:ATP-binding protein [Novosphingobium sp. PP1Y]CCA92531.1 sensory transduction histidine kinase [Novosphingobium sp. PP1Y]
MRTLFNSAAYRIAFASSLAFALATALIGIAVFYAAHAAFVRQMESSVDQASIGIIAELRDEGVRGVLEAVHNREAGGPDALGYAVFAPSGTRVEGSLDTPMPETGWRDIVFLDPHEGPDPARAKTTMLPGGYRLTVAADKEPLEQIDATILTIFGIAFACLLAIGLAGALILGAYLRRRLTRIEATAGAIAGGDLSRRMAVGPRDDEFDRVAASLNAMLDRIAGLIANLRQVTSDLAHDLRTPLMRLRNQLDALHEPGENDMRSARIDDAVERADEVLRLFEAILRISELEEGSLHRNFSSVDLGALVRDLGEAHEPLAEDAGKTLLVRVAGDARVTGDRELLAQALINLIENALRHTPPGSAIEIGVRIEAGRPVAYVADNGPGIPADQRAHVLERFVRLEASRSTPGNGLGLSLAAAVAAAHRAELRLADNAPGLEVAIVFPKEPR